MQTLILEKKRTNPFKVLCLLYFGRYSFMEVYPGGIIELRTVSKMAKMLRLRSHKMHIYLDWLQQHNYIADLVRHGPQGRYARFRLLQPPNLKQLHTSGVDA